jgi:hypothetical protein
MPKANRIKLYSVIRTFKDEEGRREEYRIPVTIKRAPVLHRHTTLNAACTHTQPIDIDSDMWDVSAAHHWNKPVKNFPVPSATYLREIFSAFLDKSIAYGSGEIIMNIWNFVTRYRFYIPNGKHHGKLIYTRIYFMRHLLHECISQVLLCMVDDHLASPKKWTGGFHVDFYDSKDSYASAMALFTAMGFKYFPRDSKDDNIYGYIPKFT